MLLVGLWANRDYPGLSVAFVGVLSNTAVIIINGGYMPIYEPSLIAAGFTAADVSSAIHVILPAGLDAAFLLRLGPLGDVIPIPVPIIQNVISIGDVFLSAGLAFFLFASVVRTPPSGSLHEGARNRSPGGQTGYSAAFTDTAALERPIMLGGTRPGMSSPSLEPMVEFGEGGVVPLRPEAPVGERIREHPYVRLALNGSFSATVDRPADLAVRRPDPPARAGRHRPVGDWFDHRDGVRRSSRPRCRTCSCRRSPARSWTAGTRRRSWSSATSSEPP